MKSILLLPILIGGMLLTGCEVTEVGRRPVVYHRDDRGHSDSYYRGRSDYYDRDSNYRRPPVYHDGYYGRSHPEYSSYDYNRTRAPYRSGVSLTVDSTVHHNRASVTRKGSSQSSYQAPVSKGKRHDKGDKKNKKKDRD